MNRQPITRVLGAAVHLAVDDVDTDQIIPARYLTTTQRSGLGTHLFADWRFAGDGAPRPDFVLNAPINAGRTILVAGRNFGCGSSREHAPWALADHGFRAIIAPSFADIFCNNALKNGLVPATLAPEHHHALVDRLRDDPQLDVVVDVEALVVIAGDDRWPFPLPPFSRRCLLEGVDQLGYLLAVASAISRFESQHPPRVNTLANS